jgi:predicted RNase H-like nuclease
VTHLGIDLAWSTRRRTGLAAVSDDGVLLDSATEVGDEALDAWVRRFPDVRVVAIDAPLVVPNPTGSRPCEKAIGVAFGRHDAGAYPSNRANRLFDPPRGLALCERHGWTVDPASPQRPLALEVYPHAAMVGLFRLPRVLPYKARRHRTVASRREALLELCDRLETLPRLGLATHPRWRELRDRVAGATRPFHLGRVEDEIDAVLCAHLAWLWHSSPGALQVYGDATEGYIVAPPAPTWPPAARVRLSAPPSPGSAPGPARPG